MARGCGLLTVRTEPGALTSPPVPGSRIVRRWLWSAGSLSAVAGLAGVGILAAAPAGAVGGAALHKRHHGSPMPVVLHAKTLKDEPVIRADKAKPPTKVLTKNLVEGTGTAATATSTVTVKYVGANYKTGRDFTQATWQAGKATSFTLHGVVPGFSAGLVGMKVGGRREIVIPSKYGYKNLSSGPIKPYETLVFVVDLEAVSS